MLFRAQTVVLVTSIDCGKRSCLHQNGSINVTESTHERVIPTVDGHWISQQTVPLTGVESIACYQRDVQDDLSGERRMRSPLVVLTLVNHVRIFTETSHHEVGPRARRRYVKVDSLALDHKRRRSVFQGIIGISHRLPQQAEK